MPSRTSAVIHNITFAGATLAGLILTALTLTGLTLAHAADLPIGLPMKAPPAAASGGFYIWTDGFYDSVRLPRFDLGWHHARSAAPTTDLGPAEGYDPRANGAGIGGAIGYMLPRGALPAMFGANARVEVNASFVDARGSQSGSSGAFDSTTGVGFFAPLLNGTIASAPALFTCAAPNPCNTTSTLATTYREWRAGAKAASDYRNGRLALTPSISVFGGEARSRHDLTELQGGVGATPYRYTASTALDWTDVGVKLGLDANVIITSWLTVGVGGSVGTSYRDASLAGNDLLVNATTLLLFGGSAITAGASTAPLLASADARIVVTPLRNLALWGFVGIDYDSRVPGISSPSFAQVVPLAGATPAGITFAAETSFHAGGGMTWRFAP